MDLVLNWLWQGVALALAATAVLAVQKPHSARTRYATWCMALLAVLALPLAGLLWPLVSVAGELSTTTPGTITVIAIPDRWWTSDAVMIGAWAGWISVHAGRLVSALVTLRRAKRRSLPLAPDIESRLALWRRRDVSGRQARLALSPFVRSAAVLGGRCPIVALSPALFEELTNEEIDCVVMHEWAHVQRRDDVAALLQAFVQVVAGWHPAVWWIGRQISAEREHACDESVVTLIGAAKPYAACLVKLASLSLTTAPAMPVVAMATSALQERVRRVLGWRAGGSMRRLRVASMATAVLVGTFATSLSTIRLVEGASAEPVVDLHMISGATTAITNVLSVTRATVAAIGPGAMSGVDRQARASRSDRQTPAAVTGAPVSTVAAPASPRETFTTEPAIVVATEPLQEIPARVAATPTAAADTVLSSLRSTLTAASVAPLPAAASPARWAAAADAGAAIGRGSQKAAVATAGFFTRVSKKVAASF